MYWIDGCVGPRTVLNKVAKVKKFLLLPENETRTAQAVAESLQRETLLHELN
jgi:hypothetical protein